MSEYIIETHNLTKRYGNQVSVSNLNIHVKQGRIYGLLGRNGAGKTTTMRMLLGLTAPTSGEVKIFGRPMQGNENKILPRIGCLIESQASVSVPPCLLHSDPVHGSVLHLPSHHCRVHYCRFYP